MTIEVLIYGYSTICLCMMIMNFYCALLRRGDNLEYKLKVRHFQRRMTQDLERFGQSYSYDKGHQVYLTKKLIHINVLLAFAEILEGLKKTNRTCYEVYTEKIQDLFVTLAQEYSRKKGIKKAYFAYFVAQYPFGEEVADKIAKILLTHYIQDASLYCRENTLSALCHLGKEAYVVKALISIDVNGYFHHEKLIIEELLSFKGNHDALIALLWEHFSKCSLSNQLAILGYMRMKSDQYTKQVYELLSDEQIDSEIHLACIRYLGKYYYKPAEPLLISYIEDHHKGTWEYAAISATALIQYPSEESIHRLRNALSSATWHVRLNAAKSLVSLGVMDEILGHLTNQEDCYAREMMHYQIHQKQQCNRLEQGAKVND